MNSKLKFAPFSNKVIEGFEYSPSSYAIAKISCPPNWEQSGPYNNSSICTNNCDGTLSYINAKSTGYNSDDTTNYCDSAKVYNPMNKEGFKNSSNNLTKGLAPKIQKYLLTQTSLASDNTNEFFQADTTILEIGDLAPQDEDEDNLVGDDTTSNPNNLGQAYVESSNNIMCPAGFSFRNDNCQVWDEAIANKDNSN
jgi:hypothetical protein